MTKEPVKEIIRMNTMKKILFLFMSLYACQSTPSAPVAVKSDQRPIVFVGTYTQKLGHVDGKATGIYTCRMDTESGALTVVDSISGIDNPSFLCISPDKKYLYAVAETGGLPDRPWGGVAAYHIRENGKLEKINDMPSYGVAPCYISTDKTGKFVLVANYVTGNVATYGVQPDGSLTDSLCVVQHPGKSPYAHMILPTPDNSAIWAVDKGNDHVYQYDLNPQGQLKETGNFQTAKGAGPRHLDFNPVNPKQFALINEDKCTVNYYHRNGDAEGGITRTDSLSTLPVGFKDKNSCADLHFHPNGKFLYGSNRGHNSIVVYGVDQASGKLSLLQHEPTRGLVPRNFLITPDGKWLLAANQNSSTVTAFQIDAATGLLRPAGEPSPVATPVCLKML